MSGMLIFFKSCRDYLVEFAKYMFFILSKVLVNLIYPITWISLGILGSFVFKSAGLKKKALVCSSIMLILFSNPYLLNLFARGWDIHTRMPAGHFSCAIVLGGFVSENQTGVGYFNGASDRFIQAIRLQKAGMVKRLLFTGGNANLIPNAFSESDWISQEIKKYGIPDSVVIIENRARNTLENAQLSFELIKRHRLKAPYLVVTSACHMRRSLQTFKNAGVEVVPYSCNYIAGREKTTFYSFIPSAEALYKWNIYIKEVIGYIAYSLQT